MNLSTQVIYYDIRIRHLIIDFNLETVVLCLLYNVLIFVDVPEVPTNVMSPKVPTSPEVPTNVTSPFISSDNTVSVDTSGADHHQISVENVVFSVKDHYNRLRLVIYLISIMF